MKQQENMSGQEMDKQLSNLFTKAGEKQAPAGFTQKIMGKIEMKDTVFAAYKPVISKTAWLVILTGIITILLFTVITFPNAGTTPKGLKELSSILNFQLWNGDIFHIQYRLLHFLSGSRILLSVLSVATVVGWRYLLMLGTSWGKRKKISGMSLF